jgi:hypothetical protein
MYTSTGRKSRNSRISSLSRHFCTIYELRSWQGIKNKIKKKIAGQTRDNQLKMHGPPWEICRTSDGVVKKINYMAELWRWNKSCPKLHSLNLSLSVTQTWKKSIKVLSKTANMSLNVFVSTLQHQPIFHIL